MEFYHAMGGAEGCRKLAEAFYGRVDRDPVLRPFFPGKTHRCAIEAFSAFLVQFLGGPAEDSRHRWFVSLRESHERFKIGPKARDAWMQTMIQSIGDVAFEENVRTALLAFFEQAAGYLVNHGAAPEKNADVALAALEQPWAAQRALDEAVAAVRAGDARRAIELAEGADLQSYCKDRRSVSAGLLAVMIGQGHADLLEYARQKLIADPELMRERYGGRTLLHAAAAAGHPTLVQLLLGLGAEPDVADDGGHPPLYCAANENGGAAVVHALVQGGADVNRQSGVKRCAALHMAARRGNLEVAEALLDCGADIEARDSQRETPLRRAVNCEMTNVAALLIARGADKHSIGSKRMTPIAAARSQGMRKLLY